MNSTTFSASKAAREGKLTQTWTASGRRIPFWFPDETVELSAGAFGVISSVVDLVSLAVSWEGLKANMNK